MLLLRKRIKNPILQVVLFNFANGNGVEYRSHLLFYQYLCPKDWNI